MGVVIGIDLSGPSNIEDTSLSLFAECDTNQLVFENLHSCVDEFRLVDTLKSIPASDRVVIGIDAPLSYNVGGGDRPGDTELRKKLVSSGMKSGSVMTPTMTRMAYLTLRGVVFARIAEAVRSDVEIAEVHPGGAMVLRGAPVQDVKDLKRSSDARFSLVKWLGTLGLSGLPHPDGLSDHDVAACAAALAAWQWHCGTPTWRHAKEPSVHPYDYVC